MARITLALIFLLFGTPLLAASLDIPLTVKEVAGVGSNGYPVKVVVPFSRGAYQNTETFRLVDRSGNTVPAQFDVLNRWWAADNSIRHLTVSFQPQVAAYTGSGKGVAIYRLKDDGKGNSISTPLQVTESEKAIEVNTGPLRFTIDKSQFTIIHELWLGDEQIISAKKSNGGKFVGRLPGDIQFDSDRTDITYSIEKSGPMEVVIKAQAQTLFENTKNHQHGFAVRIYAYAGKPYLKIDYQLQNSALVTRSWPLYFREMSLNFALDLAAQHVVRIDPGNGKIYARDGGMSINQDKPAVKGSTIVDLSDNSTVAKHNPKRAVLSKAITSTYIDVRDGSRGVMATIRNFWQTFPNELSVDANNSLKISMWPDHPGQCQWEDQDGGYLREKSGAPCRTDARNPAGDLYWLDDMQHVYKEVFLYFHNAAVSESELSKLAKTVQEHPVVAIPTAQYQRASATVDMGGIIPSGKSIPTDDVRKYVFKSKDFSTRWPNYRFGWDSFYVDYKNRKHKPATAGGWPSMDHKTNAARFLVTGNPRDYWVADLYSIGELNARNHSLANYKYDTHFAICQLKDKYAGPTWRSKGLAARRLRPSWLMKTPRDDEHGWFYFMEEAYYITANPWIKDWYEFIAEFRKGQLASPRSNDNSSRAIGNRISNALQAYRVTGDMDLLDRMPSYVKAVRSWVYRQYGFKRSVGSRESAMQAGYMMRAITSYMSEIRGINEDAWAESFQFLSAYMEWNYRFCNFSLYIDARKYKPRRSECSGLTLVDPQAWYYWHTGITKYYDHLIAYLTTGLNGGGRPCGRYNSWQGQFEGRWMLYIRKTPRTDATPPVAIADLSVSKDGKNIQLKWSPPADAAYYHIVYGSRPISPDFTTDKDYLNWWAARTVGNSCVTTVNGEATCSLQADETDNIYAAVFSFDASDNMSAMSNLGTLSSGTVSLQ